MGLHRKLKQTHSASVTCAAILFSVVAQVGWAQNVDELYDRGQRAYERSQYADALCFLYAYEIIAGNDGSTNQQLVSEVRAARSYALQQVRQAVDTREQLLQHGEVREVVLLIEGKADLPGQRGGAVRVAVPQALNRAKPRLRPRRGQ